MISLQKYIIESVYLIPLYNTYNDMMKFRPSSYLSTNGSKSSSPFLHTVGLFCLIFQFCLMYRLICKKPAHILSAQMALVSTFFQMFIVLVMYNFGGSLLKIIYLIYKTLWIVGIFQFLIVFQAAKVFSFSIDLQRLFYFLRFLNIHRTRWYLIHVYKHNKQKML